MTEPRPARTWGARLLPQDPVAVLAVAGLTWWLHGALPGSWLVGLPAVALGHFFLFCNLFRVRTRYELAWTAAFLANVGAWQLAGTLAWSHVLAVQTPLTLLALGAEVRSPEYHGLFADRWNPRLGAWLEG